MTELDEKEKELFESYEADEWVSSKGLDAKRRTYAEIARTTFRKGRRVNIRISTKDLESIQQKSLEEGLPYQTLIASILHKYITGRLVEKA
ncbi:MAG: antitoxin [Calditrichaeota bacterium]|nr:antitoxin [Calditrichota bacterium]